MSARLAAHWREQRERGGRAPLRFGVWLALQCSRPVGRVVLVPVALYFMLAASRARRASRQFLTLALGRPARWSEVFRHFHTFAVTLVDRIYLIHGRRDSLSITVHNEAALWSALKPGRGCLLMGSHLGNFELLGIVGSVEKKLPINVVMHLDQAANLRELMFESGQVPSYNVIALGTPGSMLRVKECLARGEVVGILADRVYGTEATRQLPFLGRPARFSLSPWRLAKITGAPVVMALGLFSGDRDYEIRFEEVLPPAAGAGLTTAAQATAGAVTGDACTVPPGLATYVAALERQARRFPCNWFNFYDFWADG